MFFVSTVHYLDTCEMYIQESNNTQTTAFLP